MKFSELLPAEDWIESYYYTGPISQYLYPFWKEKFVEIVNSPVPINEVILTGSIGGGKTYFANVLLVRKLYELAVLGEEMWDYLGIAKGSAVYFLYFSVSLQQARFGGYQELVNMIDSIPFFQEKFPRDKDVESYLRFPNNIFVVPGSKFQHQVGLNVLGSVLDEANFRLEKDKYEAAFRLYVTVLERRLSRFVKEGRDLGISILVSSSLSENAFVESRIREVKGRENVKVIYVSSLEVKREKIGVKESEEDFVVFVGDGVLMPRIVESWEDFVEVMKDLGVQVPETDIKDVKYVVKNDVELQRWFKVVPGVFRGVFESDIVMAVRDVLGVSVADDTRLVKSLKVYEEALSGENVFVKEVVELSMYDDYPLSMWFDIARIPQEKRWIPRWIHCDLALGRDCRVGIACSYVEDVKKDETGRVLPVVRVEWMVGIERSVKYRMDDEIPFWKIREFILWLRQRGINVVGVSFDSFQSADMVQLLQRAGLKVEKVSVDVNDEPYVNLVQMYLERRIRHPRHDLYRRELFNLEWDRVKRKVLRGSGMTKDVADAVCGSVYMVVKNFDEGVVRMGEFAEYNRGEVDIQEFDIFEELKKEAMKQRFGKWWMRGVR